MFEGRIGIKVSATNGGREERRGVEVKIDSKDLSLAAGHAGQQDRTGGARYRGSRPKPGFSWTEWAKRQREKKSNEMDNDGRTDGQITLAVIEQQPQAVKVEVSSIEHGLRTKRVKTPGR